MSTVFHQFVELAVWSAKVQVSLAPVFANRADLDASLTQVGCGSLEIIHNRVVSPIPPGEATANMDPSGNPNRSASTPSTWTRGNDNVSLRKLIISERRGVEVPAKTSPRMRMPPYSRKATIPTTHLL
jgi:hypothetical protein